MVKPLYTSFPSTKPLLGLFYFSHVQFEHFIFEKHDRYYIGHCEDIDKRLERHNAGMVPSNRPYLPWVVVYQEVYETKQEATAREMYVKRMKSRKFIEALIHRR